MDLKKRRSEMLDSYTELTQELEEAESNATEIRNNIMRLQGAIALLNEQIGHALWMWEAQIDW